MGSVNSHLTCFFYYNFSPPVFWSAGGGSAAKRVEGVWGVNLQPPCTPMLLGSYNFDMNYAFNI